MHNPIWLEHVCVCLVAQLCLTVCNPLDCSPPGFSVHGIFQAKILEGIAISFSKGSSWPRDWTYVSCISWIGGRFFTHWAIREASWLEQRECEREQWEVKLWRRLNLVQGILPKPGQEIWASSHSTRGVGRHGRFLRTESWKLSELCIWTLNQAYHARGLPLSLVAVSFFKSSSYGHDDSHDFLNLSSVLFHLSLGWLMEKLHLFSLRALVWLSHHIKSCFCAFFLCHCFCTHISRFAFLFLPLSPPSFSQERSQVSYLSHPAKGWVTSSSSAEHSATHWPSCIWSSHSPGHWKSHQSFHNLSSALWKAIFFISSMKTCCYKAFLLTTEILLSLFQVASWFFLSKVFPFLSQLY